MRDGSKASASRARLDLTPSIHIVSELTWKKGEGPSSGSALTTPRRRCRAPVALVGDDHARGRLRDAT